MTDETQPNQPRPPEAPAPSDGSADPQPSRSNAPNETGPAAGAKGPEPRGQDDRPPIIARYGLLGVVGQFTCPKKITFQPGSKLVLQTERGIEVGQHVPLCPAGESRPQIDCERVRRYVEQSGPDYLNQRVGRVLRVATEQDLAEERRINAGAAEELTFCRELIRTHGLPMKLITCEHVFGGERVIFYFMADGRVDFRQLVRDLAREYQTRIEMRQVGARDEARLVGDYEICGRECCCKNFLKTLRPVSMKMAKMQKATLDPSKVSGRCGRLRCCLRYENEVYDDLNERLPRNNNWVRTAQGEGKVVDRQIITQLVTVQFDDQRRITFPLEEIEVLADRPPQRAPAPPEPPQDQRDQPERPAESGAARGRSRGRRGRRRESVAEPAQSPEEAARAPSSQDAESGLPVSGSRSEPDPGPETPTSERRPPAADAKASSSAQADSGPSRPGRKRRSRRRRKGRRDRGGPGGDGNKKSSNGP